MNERTINGYAAELSALTRWLQKQRDDGALRVVLRQRATAGGGADQRVREWKIAEAASAAELASSIHTRAMEDAAFQRGPVHYGLFSYGAAKHYTDRTFLTVDPDQDATPRAGTALATLDTGGGLNDERAQAASVVGLLMKHTHASAQLALGTTIDIVAHYKEESERKDTRIRELEERQAKVLAMYEELLSAKHERELEMLRATNSEKRKDHLLEKLDMLIPVAVSKVLPGGGKNAALGEELMRQLLKSLSREQLGALVGHLNPEQAALIHEIYVAYCEREEQRDAAKRANGVNGHATTNGGQA